MDTGPVVLSREMYRQEAFDKRYPDPDKRIKSLTEGIKSQCYCSKKRAWKFITTVLPIIDVIKTYKIKEYIGGDILAGLTVAIMHIPQGLGFGFLASLKPIYGLYTSFWPVLFYMLFGTSSHVSFGTNAVICLLVAAITSRQMETFSIEPPGETTKSVFNVTTNTTIFMNASDDLTVYEDVALDYRVSISAATAFIAGAILLGMGILRLGFITLYLSDSFISGFTTGAAVHIATSQVPKMLAVKTGSIQGAGKIIKTYIAIFTNIKQTNITDLVIAIISVTVLMLVKECINERFKTKMKMPVPIDLIVVIIGTIISHFARFQATFGVAIVGEIPPGIPPPEVPPLNEVANFAVDSFVIAILIFAMTIAMAKLCAKKHSYEIDDNQELVAYGLANMLSSFFLCFPSCVAPPRTMLQSSMGAKTSLCAVFTSALIFLVIMAIGPLFEALPVSLLAAMIVVAMKGLFMQVFDLKLYWRVNIFDFISWLGTFLSVVLIDIDIGLAVGIGISAFTVIIQSQFAQAYLLGKSSDEEIFAKAERKGIKGVTGVKIFRFEASVYYATAEIFRSKLYAKTLNPKKALKARAKSAKLTNAIRKPPIYRSLTESGKPLPTTDIHVKDEINSNDDGLLATPEEEITHVIIDSRPMTYIDIAGIKMIGQVAKELKTVDVAVFLYGCSNSSERLKELPSLTPSLETMCSWISTTLYKPHFCRPHLLTWESEHLAKLYVTLYIL